MRGPILIASLLAAVAAALLAVAVAGPGAPPQAVIAGGGQRVRVTMASRPGPAGSVCLEAAPGVTGRKRAVVAYDGGSVSLTTHQGDPGPNCAHVPAAAEGEVSVRLEYVRLMVFPARLDTWSAPARSLRGRRVTFRWERE